MDLDANTTAEPSTAVEDVNAESSAAAEDVEEETAFGAMDAVLSDGESSAPKDNTEEPEPKPQPEGEDPEARAKAQEEEDKKLPFHEHPRWKQVLQERNEAKARLVEYEKELEPVRAKAAKLEQAEAFFQEYGLTDEEVAAGHQIMALMKVNPAQAYKALLPTVQNLQRFTGEVLPPDLQQQVDEGYVSLDLARELAARRIDAKLSEGKQEQSRQKAENEKLQTLRRTQGDAVNRLEQTWRASDPDYERKQAFVEAELSRLIITKQPSTVEEALALANEAKQRVDAQVRSLIPKPPISREPSGARNPQRITAAPTTPQEAMEQALAGK